MRVFLGGESEGDEVGAGHRGRAGVRSAPRRPSEACRGLRSAHRRQPPPAPGPPGRWSPGPRRCRQAATVPCRQVRQRWLPRCRRLRHRGLPVGRAAAGPSSRSRRRSLISAIARAGGPEPSPALRTESRSAGWLLRLPAARWRRTVRPWAAPAAVRNGWSSSCQLRCRQAAGTGIRRPAALPSGACRQSGSLPAPVRSASGRWRGRRGDRVGPSTSGFAGSSAPKTADRGERLGPLPAPFLSGLLPPLDTSHSHHAGCPGVKAGEAAERSEGSLEARASRRWWAGRARGGEREVDGGCVGNGRRGGKVASVPPHTEKSVQWLRGEADAPQARRCRRRSSRTAAR